LQRNQVLIPLNLQLRGGGMAIILPAAGSLSSHSPGFHLSGPDTKRLMDLSSLPAGAGACSISGFYLF
jgi:hypothetical protein